MANYTIANVSELAKALLKLNEGEEISFGIDFDVDDNGDIDLCSVTNFFGATIIRRFDGYCLMAGIYGGGEWHSYDVSGLLSSPLHMKP